jgi:hypothetical protein
MTFNFKTKRGRREVYWTMYTALKGIDNREEYNNSYELFRERTIYNFPIFGMCNLVDVIKDRESISLPELSAQKPKRIKTFTYYWWDLQIIKKNSAGCRFTTYNKEPRLKALLAAIELTYK